MSLGNNPIEAVVQAMAERRPSSNQQLALSAGEGGGPGGGGAGDLHAQTVNKPEGWQGQWTPVDQEMLRQIINEIMPRLANPARVNWFAGQ